MGITVTVALCQINSLGMRLCSTCYSGRLCSNSTSSKCSRVQRTADRHPAMPRRTLRHCRGSNGELCDECRPGSRQHQDLCNRYQELLTFDRRTTHLSSYLLNMHRVISDKFEPNAGQNKWGRGQVLYRGWEFPRVPLLNFT